MIQSCKPLIFYFKKNVVPVQIHISVSPINSIRRHGDTKDSSNSRKNKSETG